MLPEIACAVVKTDYTDDQWRRLDAAESIDEASGIMDEAEWEVALGQRQRSIYKRVRAERDARLEANPAKANKALMDDISGGGFRQKSGTVSMERRAEAIETNAFREMADELEDFAPDWKGVRGRIEDQRKLVDAIFEIGASTKKVTQKNIVKFAEGWKRATDNLFKRFNKAGGDVKYRKDFAVPMRHDSAALARTTKEAWISFVIPKIKLDDLPKIPGKTPDQILGYIYTHTKSERAIDLPEALRKAIGDKHQKHRALNFKDGQSWNDYHLRFGKGDPLDAMLGYIEYMSRDIAAMEKFGPNPDAMVKSLVQKTKKLTGKKAAGELSQRVYNNLMNRDMGVETPLGNVLRNFRSYQTITKLGKAPITALSDVAYSALANVHNGTRFLRQMKFAMRQLTNSKADRKLALKLQIIGEHVIDHARQVNRYSGEAGFGKLQKLANVSVRLTGLQQWTQSMKRAFGLEFMASLAEQSKIGFNPRMKKAFRRYGISDAEVEQLKGAITTDRGIDFLDVAELQDTDLATRVIGMMREEMNMAIPEPNAKVRTIAQGGIRVNTLTSEIIKSQTQFKTFSISTLMNQGGRMVYGGDQGSFNGMYALQLAFATSTVGAGVLMAKDFLAGRTMRDMDTPEVYKDAFIQGGSVGIAGDIVFQDPNKFGGVPAYLLGPSFSDAVEAHKLVYGIATKQDIDSLMKAGRFGVDAVTGVATGGLDDAWWTSLAADRLIFNNIGRNIDPTWRKRQRQRRKWMKSERGQEEWWGPNTSSDVVSF